MYLLSSMKSFEPNSSASLERRDGGVQSLVGRRCQLRDDVLRLGAVLGLDLVEDLALELGVAHQIADEFFNHHVRRRVVDRGVVVVFRGSPLSRLDGQPTRWSSPRWPVGRRCEAGASAHDRTSPATSSSNARSPAAQESRTEGLCNSGVIRPRNIRKTLELAGTVQVQNSAISL